METATPIYRVRWTLQARADWSLHSHQNAILYALLCDASRGGEEQGASLAAPGLPEGLLLDAPERCRDRYEPGERFAFGATLLEPDPHRAARLVQRLSEGLIRLGHVRPQRPVALGGNFDLVDVQDLVAARPLAPGEPPRALGMEAVGAEMEQLARRAGAGSTTLTVRFLSPLRLERPAADAGDGHRYADLSLFHAGQFLRAVQKRMAAAGLRRADLERDPPLPDEALTLVENRLVWLDLEYGRRDLRKSLGGALGRVRLDVFDPLARAVLVWGQYLRVGKNLHFGFGHYRIEELGPDPVECRRARPLLDACLAPAAVTRAAAEHGLELDAFRRAAEQLRTGVYQPGSSRRITLREPDGGSRVLNVPPVQDRALQRLLLARLGPAVARLFETSSFAWRRGLSREAAARRIDRLVRDGWRLAVRADFDRFFDRVPLGLLRDRLDAWLGDDEAAAAVMRFVQAEGSSPPAAAGLPTGAPLSPLLANLLLDRFDETIEAEGGKLVRYADDFLILTRRREDAERLHARAQELAGQLLLELNADSAVLDLREPFEFLGYRFRHEERWEYAGPSGPRRVEEFGWRDAERTLSPLLLPLPGESPRAGAAGVVVAGPGLERLDVVGDAVHLRGPERADDVEVPLAALERLVVLGPAGWAADAPGKLLRAGVPVHLVSEGGWPLGDLLSAPADDAEALIAQCRAAADPAVALGLARPLVRAKLRNFAALLDAAAGPGRPAAARLRELAARIEEGGVDSLDTLRGLEGAGAAAWYRELPALLGRGFAFPGRVMPDASDPVNVLLNLGHTMLHRHAAAACRAAGLSPAIGFLHRGDGRYAALAADLQEPFRHVVERAVILATRRLRPSQFVPRFDGPYSLALDHHAARSFHALLQRGWRAAVARRGQDEPRAWLAQVVATARGLRRRLLDPDVPWEPFEHP